MTQAASFNDTLNAQFFIVSSLVMAHKLDSAFEAALTVLDQLGEGITSDLDNDECDKQIDRTLSKVLEVSVDALRSYSIMMKNPVKATAMRILARMQSVAVLSKSSLHPFLITKMVDISTTHGEIK